MGQQTHHVGGEAVLVVVPGNELHEVAVQGDKALEIQTFFSFTWPFFCMFQGLKYCIVVTPERTTYYIPKYTIDNTVVQGNHQYD